MEIRILASAGGKTLDDDGILQQEYFLRLIQGNQSFDLEYRGTQEEAVWYGQMFRKALDNLKEETLKEATGGANGIQQTDSPSNQSTA